MDKSSTLPKLQVQNSLSPKKVSEKILTYFKAGMDTLAFVSNTTTISN